MNNTSCNVESYWPLPEACGVHGDCINGRCECNDGFTNYGDFSLSPVAPCELNIAAIISLWAVSIFISLFNVRVAIWGITSRQVSLHTWRGSFMAGLSILQSGIMIALAVVRIVGPTKFVVGGDLTFTLLHIFFILTLGAHLFITLGGFLRAHEMAKASTVGPDQRREFHIQARNRIACLVLIYLILSPTTFTPLLLLSQPDNQQLVIIVHGVPLILIFLFMGGYFTPRLLASMLKGVQQSLDIVEPSRRSQLERIAFKLRWIKISAAVAFPFISLVIIILVFWPYMTTKLSYTLPVLYTLANIATILTVWGAITTSENAIRRPSMPFFSRFFPRFESPDMEMLKKNVAVVNQPVDELITGENGKTEASYAAG